jgi:hypothetical protein
MGHSCHLVWLAHVRKGSKATVRRYPRYFRFTPESRHSAIQRKVRHVSKVPTTDMASAMRCNARMAFVGTAGVRPVPSSNNHYESGA